MARRPKNPINDLGDRVGAWLGGSVRQAIVSTPARAVENLQNVVGNTPIGIAVQRAMTGAQTFRNEGYLSAVQQQAKFAGTDIALNAAGGVAGRAVGKITSRVSSSRGVLRSGEDLAFHFSNNANLKTIKDIKALRNQGANFGQKFDSTKFSPPGSTYGYGPLQGTGGVQELQASLSEAGRSYQAAKALGQERNYTLYVTRAKPLKGAKSGISDPEYRGDLLSGKQGESIYGKQKVIAKFDMRVPEVQNIPLGTSGKSFTENIQQQSDAQKKIADEIYNTVVSNRKVVKAGLKPSNVQNPFSMQAGANPIPRSSMNVSNARNSSVDALLGSSVSVSAPKKKARGGGKNKK